MSRHKKENHEEHADESWLVPYADLLTLLLALFIVLFASSSIDQEKIQSMAAAFYGEFIGGVTEGGAPISKGSVIDAEFVEQNLTAREEYEEPIDNLYDSIEKHVEESEDFKDIIGLERIGEDILITLKSDIWFESGSADITPEMMEEVDMIARLLNQNQDEERPFEVVVTGHTDNVPIHSSRYPSNWHLSMERAVNFLEVLLTSGHFNPVYFSSRGYGEHKPLDTNDTPEGRQRNRRVELLVSNAFDESSASDN
ncbi:MAG: OmpA family protein [Clostridiales bacterium]|nr:OmpA family protein [Clostridiales bacterium]